MHNTRKAPARTSALRVWKIGSDNRTVRGRSSDPVNGGSRASRCDLVLLFACAALLAVTMFGQAGDSTPATSAIASPAMREPRSGQPPQTLAALLQLKPEMLEQCDLATMNLLCGEGLRGANELKAESCLETLDAWTRHVAAETTRNFHRFAANPKDYGDSLPYYRMMMLATVLQEDFGTLYNPDRAQPQLRGEWEPNDSFFADSRDVFLHGLLRDKHAGTCSSLPVLYVAVAQRMGYPVHLAAAKGHFYVRYDDGDEHLNVEATSLGFNTYPDEHYRHWPLPTTDAEARQYGLLRPLNNREVLGAFLTIRANCLTSMKQFGAAAEAWAQAARLLPHTPALEGIVARARARASHEAVASRWDALWDQVAGLAIPYGLDAARFRQRQYQVQFCMNQSTNLAEIESLVGDLANELQAHRRQAMLNSDAPAQAALLLEPSQTPEPPGPGALASQSPAVLRFRIAAERVPCDYWQGIPAELEPQLRGLTSEEHVVAEMWAFHAGQVNRATREAAAVLAAQRPPPTPPPSSVQGQLPGPQVPGSPLRSAAGFQPTTQAAPLPPARSSASPGRQPGAVPGNYPSVAGGLPAAGPPIQIEIIHAKTNP
jgi:hypothetical protein